MMMCTLFCLFGECADAYIFTSKITIQRNILMFIFRVQCERTYILYRSYRNPEIITCRYFHSYIELQNVNLYKRDGY